MLLRYFCTYAAEVNMRKLIVYHGFKGNIQKATLFDIFFSVLKPTFLTGHNGAGTKSRAALAGGGDFILLPFEKWLVGPPEGQRGQEYKILPLYP